METSGNEASKEVVKLFEMVFNLFFFILKRMLNISD